MGNQYHITFGLKPTDEEVRQGYQGIVIEATPGKGVLNAITEIFSQEKIGLLENYRTTNKGKELTAKKPIPFKLDEAIRRLPNVEAVTVVPFRPNGNGKAVRDAFPLDVK
jgi:hypothetical protein